MKNYFISADDTSLYHLTGYGHPESPFRYKVAKAALESKGLLKTLLPKRLSTDSKNSHA